MNEDEVAKQIPFRSESEADACYERKQVQDNRVGRDANGTCSDHL